MKKILLIVILIIVFSVSFLSANITDTLTSAAIKTGLDLISMPNDFLIEINTDVAETSSSFFCNRVQIHLSLFWNIFGVGNIQVKANAYDGDKIIPVITPGFSYWNAWLVKLISDDDFSASMQGFTPFITFSKQMERDIKLFGGVKYAVGFINLALNNDSSSSDDSIFDFSNIANISSSYGKLGLYMGINYLRLSGKEVVAQIGYYPGMRKIFSKLQVSGKVFTWGISLYPDSYMLVHLFWNMNINI